MVRGLTKVSAAELQRFLRGADYPANREDLLDLAEQNGAPDEVLDILEQMPDEEFNSPIEVEQAFSELESGGGGRSDRSRGGRGGGGGGESERQRMSRGQVGETRGGRTTGGRGRSEGGVSAAELQRYLRGADYPANPDELIELAEENGAPEEVLQILEQLPDEDFNSPIEVEQAFSELESGGEEESRGRSRRGGGLEETRRTRMARGQEEETEEGGRAAPHRRGRAEGRSMRGLTGRSPANVERFLRGADYPATREDLCELAEQNGAPEEILQILEQFPDEEFDSPIDVMKAYSEVESGREGGVGGRGRGGRGEEERETSRRVRSGGRERHGYNGPGHGRREYERSSRHGR